MKWYQNKYVQAGAIALITGIISAATIYVATMTDGLDARHTIKVVATAFLAPFSLLLSVLPRITDILVPTVRLISNAPLDQQRMAATQENVIEVHDAENTVVVGTRERDAAGRFLPIPSQ